MFVERFSGAKSGANVGERNFVSPEQAPSSSPKERVLVENNIERIMLLEGGGIGNARNAQYVKIEGNGGAVFKPHDGYSEPKRTMYINCERAAYLIDRFLGFNFVPTTVIRKFQKEKGSLQEFVENAQTAYSIDKHLIPPEELIKLKLFDFIIQNSDRHSGNYLIKENKIWAIDHGFAFDAQHVYCFMPYGLANKKIPSSVVESLRKFTAWKAGIDLLRDLLSELLPNADECIARIFAIIEAIDNNNTISEEGAKLALQKRQGILDEKPF